jgi:hypothetical protein
MALKAEIYCHKNFLVINTLDTRHDNNFIPIGESRIGCVLTETDKYLGMSDEAFSLLKTMQLSGDDIGDVSTWKSKDGKDCIAWLGGFKRLIDMNTAETDNKGISDIKYVKIQNKVPEDAMKVIKELEGEE